MVKKSSQEVADGYLDEECLFLDSDDEKDRRVKALSGYEKNKSKDEN